MNYRGLVIVWPLAVAFCLSSCGIIPQSGPASVTIPMETDTLPYAFIKLTADVAEKLGRYSTTISNVFSDRRPPRDFEYGVGDVVSVTIFESAAGGLFIPAEAGVRPGNFITLPNQAVDSNGNISVPYAGNIHAKGAHPRSGSTGDRRCA